MPLQLLGTFSCKIATQSVAKTQSGGLESAWLRVTYTKHGGTYPYDAFDRGNPILTQIAQLLVIWA